MYLTSPRHDFITSDCRAFIRHFTMFGSFTASVALSCALAGYTYVASPHTLALMSELAFSTACWLYWESSSIVCYGFTSPDTV